MSPYRPLPIAKTSALAVCAWCKHANVQPHRVTTCSARRRVEIDPVAGRTVVDASRDCYIVRSVLREKGESGCPDYAPSLVTRLLRLAGWRR
ncbi:MAG TPA: hypothetical protein VJP45_08755 [Candidatus Limnocylindria bacterium]|nr:hypothetical protein [Candidatus Limnocylindria bacterium]